ncbi:toprim domain-containing protein [Mycoplasma struthionis]|uniref:Recombination protein RecR n=1 Tax=Mycoplasma struthionis TaxID=538220 RepID=A0A3G8LJ68_9MOLU|nr:toprim domain-containing protein [Mycoplasma struthionis]AZG68922.1 recombination protein RecR [Mycoplasma struthionis]TPI01163.1 recombination protein RecR [Mycoplasma struthionis]
MNNEEYLKLEKKLKEIPGLSKRQIQKIADFIIDKKTEEINEIVQTILEYKTNIKKCINCNYVSKDELCKFCSDSSRENILLVVEKSVDVDKFEELNSYKGKYFVIDDVWKKQKEKVQDKALEKLLSIANKYKEITLALSSSFDGQFSMIYLQKMLKEKAKFENVYQLAIGIPIGASVEYVDNVTLKQSLIKKVKM